MGQYYDFGAQVGALLGEAMNRAERSRQFDAAQAADYMKMQEGIKQWKSEFQARREESTRSYNQSVGVENANALESLRDDYVSADAIKALGLNPKTFTGVSGKSINEQYSKVYGRATSIVPDDAMMYDAKTISAAKASLDQARAIEKMTPRVISGIENIPMPKTERVMQQENVATIPIDLPKFSSPLYRMVSERSKRDPQQKNAVRQEMLQELKARIPSLDTNNIVDVSYDGNKKQATIKYAQTGETGPDGLPTPLEERQKYSKEDVSKFFRETYPKILADYSRMTPLDKQRDEQTLVSVGGALQNMIQEFPEYSQAIQPFSQYTQAYNALREDKMAQRATQFQLQANQQRINMLKSIATPTSTASEEDKQKAMQALIEASQ